MRAEKIVSLNRHQDLSIRIKNLYGTKVPTESAMHEMPHSWIMLRYVTVEKIWGKTIRLHDAYDPSDKYGPLLPHSYLRSLIRPGDSFLVCMGKRADGAWEFLYMSPPVEKLP